LKIWSITFDPSMLEFSMSIFRPLASLVWEENELTDWHTWDVTPHPYTKYLDSTLALLGREKWTFKFVKTNMKVSNVCLSGIVPISKHCGLKYPFVVVWANPFVVAWEPFVIRACYVPRMTCMPSAFFINAIWLCCHWEPSNRCQMSECQKGL